MIDLSTAGPGEAPSIRIKPAEDLEKKEGQSITFECEATGNPTPQVHWIKYVRAKLSL